MRLLPTQSFSAWFTRLTDFTGRRSENRAKEMNEVCKNSHAFMEVLKMARSEAVERWDEAALQKAFKWAQYFEEVYCKLKTKPVLAEKLEQYLLNFRKSTCIYLGNLHLSFQMLQHSKEILRQCLLQNPHLSQKLTEVLLQLYGIGIGEKAPPANNVESLLQDIVTLSQSKAAVQMLSKMTDCLTIDLKEAQSVHVGDRFGRTCEELYDIQFAPREVGVYAAAQCLFQYLQHHLKHGGKNDKGKLHKKLVELALQDCGLHTIIMLLSQSPLDHQLDTCTHTDEVTQFVLEWVVEYISHADSNEVLLELPPWLLGQVSSIYISFFKVYFSQLISWGNSMMPLAVFSCRETVIRWRHNDSTKENSLNFYKLVRHIRALSSGPPYLAEISTKALNSLATEKASAACKGVDQNNSSILNEVNIWREILALVNCC